MVALKWTMRNHYGVDPGETYWAASDVGWVVGHSYICYAPLLHGCTVGDLRGQAGRHARCRRLLARDRRARRVARCSPRRPPSAPSRRRTPRASTSSATTCAPSARCSWPASAPIPRPSSGRRRNLNVPVYDHWWQTETGWAICGNPVGLGALPVKYGSPTVPMPGYDLQALDAAGQAGEARRDRHARHQAAAAAVVPADAVEQRRALPHELPRRLPRLLHHLGCRLHRRRRLRLRDGAHRRRHQRRRTSPLHRPDGGGGRPAQGRGRMRRGRRRRRDEGPDPGRLHRAQRRRQPADRRRSRARSSSWCARRSAPSPPSRR